jgi:hypothetical protein
VSFPGGFDALVAEIEKCDLVCANCHRIRTFTRQQNRRRVKREVQETAHLSLLEVIDDKAA